MVPNDIVSLDSISLTEKCYLISAEKRTSSLSFSLKMKEATGMCAMSSVIMSTWVITLSTLSRYLPKDVVAHIYLLQKSRFIYHLPAMITIVQVLGTFIPWVLGTSWRPLRVSALSSCIRTFFFIKVFYV